MEKNRLMPKNSLRNQIERMIEKRVERTGGKKKKMIIENMIKKGVIQGKRNKNKLKKN